MLNRRDCGLEASTSFARSTSWEQQHRRDCNQHLQPFTSKRLSEQCNRRVRCRVAEDWVSDLAHNLVVNPEQIVETSVAYGLGITAVAASAFLGINVLLWDYRERRSDDSTRFADLQSPFHGLELQRSSQDLLGVFFNLLRFYSDPFAEELQLTEEEQTAFIDRTFVSEDWSAASDLMQLFMKSTYRRWNAVSFGVVAWMLAHRSGLSPPITWDLLERSDDIACNPPMKDWRQPLSGAFLTQDVAEGAALHSLELLMRSRKTVFLLQRLHALCQSNFSYLYGS